MKTQFVHATSSPYALAPETNDRRFAVLSDDVNATEVSERLDWQALRASISIDTSSLNFLPNGPHQVAAMANLGAELLQEVKAYRPAFQWKSSPAEIVGALIEEISAAACDAAAQAVLMQHQQPGVEIGIHYPAKATPALFDVLGLPNFRTGPIAHVFRAAGADVRTKCEDEQAFVLDRFLRLAIKHGDSWREAAEADIKAAYERVNTGKAGA